MQIKLFFFFFKKKRLLLEDWVQMGQYHVDGINSMSTILKILNVYYHIYKAHISY